MYIRAHTWGRGDLSWSRVMERLLSAADAAGHRSLFLSTNGYDDMRWWTAERAEARAAELKQQMGAEPFDIDISYTIPTNFSNRFLSSSRVKIGRYDYESSHLPVGMARYFDAADVLVGSSDFVLDIFRRAGADPSRLRKIWSGVDLNEFNPDGPTLNRSAMGADENTHIFLCVAEPHYRKQLDKLIETYCDVFVGRKDVLLVIKTKIFAPGYVPRGFEQDIRVALGAAALKHGQQTPPIKVIGGHVRSLGALFRTCDTFVLPTVGEGWGMPFLEAMASGNIVIAPNYGGQLEFLTQSNSLLCPTYVRKARITEAYGVPGMDPHPDGTVGAPHMAQFGELMQYAKEHRQTLKNTIVQQGLEDAKRYTWAVAANQMIEIANEFTS